MKKTFAKILALALCAVFLVTGTVFITLAYLQDSTNVVKNTFTSANINIRLEETDVDEFGKAIAGAAKVQFGQEYRLVPGEEYLKDPTVVVEAGSENCYLVIAIHDTMFKGTNIEVNYQNKGTIYDQLKANGWHELDAKYSLADSFFESKPDADGKETNLMASWRTVTLDPDTGLDETVDSYTLYFYGGTTEISAVTEATATIERSAEEQSRVIFEGFKLEGEMNDAQSGILASAGTRSLEIIAFAFQCTGYGDTNGMNGPEIIGKAFAANFGNPTNNNTGSGGITGT